MLWREQQCPLVVINANWRGLFTKSNNRRSIWSLRKIYRNDFTLYNLYYLFCFTLWTEFKVGTCWSCFKYGNWKTMKKGTLCKELICLFIHQSFYWINFIPMQASLCLLMNPSFNFLISPSFQIYSSVHLQRLKYYHTLIFSLSLRNVEISTWNQSLSLENKGI